jgi:hypothetical protein
MRFKGLIGTVPVFALIDSDSTHSFINPSILNEQLHPIVTTNPIVIMVANGDQMVTDSTYNAL